MILKMFTVYDSKAEAHLPPFFQASTQVAKRIFGDACQDKNHQFGKHPADYTLLEIGQFDDETGSIFAYEKMQNLGTGLIYLSSNIDETQGDLDV